MLMPARPGSNNYTLDFFHTFFQFVLAPYLRLLNFLGKDYFEKLQMSLEVACLRSALQLFFLTFVH